MMIKFTSDKLIWKTTKKTILCCRGPIILFEDTIDHWQNGICRLLKLNDQTVRDWIEYCLNFSEHMNAVELIRASNKFFDCNPLKINKKNELIIYASSVEDDETVCIAGSLDEKHAKLLDVNTGSLAAAPEYSEDYFQHGTNARKGYGNLFAQSDWRIEKAYRFFDLVMQNIDVPEIKNGKRLKVLDVGSGYGHMRLPFEENGYSTIGLEISEFAANVAEANYNLKTIIGDLSSLEEDQEYGIILCYDIIEHVENPSRFLRKLNKLNENGGYLVIRTPNLGSLEAKVFGDQFHSFKLEHLNYFSVESLSLLLMEHGFEIILVSTFSHLFDGFKCIDTASIERSHLGSDIFCVVRKI